MFLHCILPGLLSSAAGHTGGLQLSVCIQKHAAAHSPTGCHLLRSHTCTIATQKTVHTHQLEAHFSTDNVSSFLGVFLPALVCLCWKPQCRSAKGLWKILPLQSTDTGYLIPCTEVRPAFNSCLLSHLVHLVHHDLHT